MGNSVKKAIMRVIESTIERGALVNGIYTSATFTYGKNTFTVVADYVVGGVRQGSAIFKNGELYRGSTVSNGRYANISLCGGASLMEHQLLAICLLPNATELLSSMKEDYHVNHMTIESDIKKKKQEYKAYKKARLTAMVEYFMTHPDANPFEPIPAEFLPEYREFDFCKPCDVRDLEVCTAEENRDHSAFIRVFDLYDTPISAKDIPLLKQFIVNKDAINHTIYLYKKFGAEMMTSMLLGV